ncbi:MAG TPA: RDD family protein [Albitalea sp.]|uniref:RDD family protein n=1 Tax=Piscinibacter sp. TaxID=1903157 RepID=UPI002ED10DFB
MGDSLDTLLTAETPEGISLALRPAGLVPRLYAYLVDFGIRIAVIIGAVQLLSPLGGFGAGLGLILYFALEWFYPVAFELAMGGATPGKKVLGLAVVMDSGLPVTPAASLTRNLLRAADFLPAFHVFAFVAMLCRADFKRLGDLAAGTLVVHLRSVQLHGELPPAPPVAPAQPLSPRAQAALVAWAGRSARLGEARLTELALIAAPAAGPAGSERETLQRLLGVAQWLLGRR